MFSSGLKAIAFKPEENIHAIKMMRKSKYPNYGILDAIEKWLYGGMSKRSYDFLETKFKTFTKKESFSKKLYDLKRQGLIKYSIKNKPIITEKGYKYINFARLEELKIENKKRDGLWRIIIFDIPEEKRAARELLRDKLVELNCYQLQKSVYVTCYACEKELNELSKLLGVNQHVCLIIAKSLGNREVAVSRYFE